jgi:hypothetical protein
MRTTAACFLFAAIALIPQQSSSDFHSLYGKSDEDRFVVRPGTYLTVRYNDHETASEMEILAMPVARDPKVAKPVFPHLNLNEAGVTALIDELAPPELRGNLIHNFDGHGGGDAQQYENVAVSRQNTECPDAPKTIPQTMNCVWRIAIKFKRDGAGGEKTAAGYGVQYGKSDLQRFMVRPGVGLTVEYSSDATACQLYVAIDRPLLGGPEPRVPYMTETLATEIEDELSPPTLRGAKLPGGGGFQSGAAYTFSEEYASVSISRSAFVCKQPERCIVGSTIQFKKKQCAGLIQRSGTPPGVFSSARIAE